MSENKQIPEFEQVEKLVDDAFACAKTIPGIGEFFYYDLFPEFQELAQDVNVNSLSIVQNIYKHYLPKSSIVLNGSDSLSESQQLDAIESLLDSIYENMDRAIDMKKGLLNPLNDTGTKSSEFSRGNAVSVNEVKYYVSMEKPQMHFSDRVDNSDSPFIPRLKQKDNALIDWDATVTDDSGLFENPYIYENDHITYPSWELETPSVINPPRPENETPLIIVDDEASMIRLCDALKQETMIAVDLEHHNYRSYQGFTCLIQISTLTTDYLIDVIQARDFVWHLNLIFTNPSIMKVFHGADMDVQWLQKDFGVYLVNLFDTGRASRVLGYESLGLAYLLKRYCNVIANKEYQRADWRIRPLTADMKKYAREDTHFLLFIAETLRKELVAHSTDTDLLEEVLKKSAEVAKQSYQKPMISLDSVTAVIEKKRLTFNPTQTVVFALLYFWRDQLARDMDESPAFILPHISLTKLAHHLPKTTSDVFHLLHPVSAIIRSHAREIVELVDAGLNGVSFDEEEIRKKVRESRESHASFTKNGENKETQEGQKSRESMDSGVKELIKKAVSMSEEEEKVESNVLDEMIEKGAKQLEKEFHPDFSQSSAPLKEIPSFPISTIPADVDSMKLSPERKQLVEEVEEAFNLEEVLKDLAMLNGGLEDEGEEEEEEEKMEEEAPEEKEVKIESIKQKYQTNETPGVSLKREKEESIEELLGVLPEKEKPKKRPNEPKPKKAKLEESLPELTQEEIQGMIHSIGADQFNVNKEQYDKEFSKFTKQKKMEKKKEAKKRYRKGREKK